MMSTNIDVRTFKLESMLAHQIQEYKEYVEKCESKYMKYDGLDDKYEDFTIKMMKNFKDFENEVNKKLITQEALVKKTFAFKAQIQHQIDAARSSMTKHWDTCSNMLIEKLNVNELRMQNIEVKHRQLMKF